MRNIKITNIASILKFPITYTLIQSTCCFSSVYTFPRACISFGKCFFYPSNMNTKAWCKIWQVDTLFKWLSLTLPLVKYDNQKLHGAWFGCLLLYNRKWPPILEPNLAAYPKLNEIKIKKWPPILVPNLAPYPKLNEI